MTLIQLLDGMIKKDPLIAKPILILGLDPGETTGYVLLEYKGEGTEPTLLHMGQLKCNVLVEAASNLCKMIEDLVPDVVVMEDYRVYSWKADSHTWASLFTPRLIGSLETLCYMKGIPCYKQMAQGAKKFCTDDKLEEWGFYKANMRHARDAVRHAVFFLLFGERTKLK